MSRFLLLGLVLFGATTTSRAQGTAKTTLADDLTALRGEWVQKVGLTETKLTVAARALNVAVIRRFDGPDGRGADITVTALSYEAEEKAAKRSLILYGSDVNKSTGSLTYKLDGNKLTLAGSGRAIDGKLYNFTGVWLRPGEVEKKPEQAKEKPVPKVDVKAPSADAACKLLEGFGFTVPNSGQTLRVNLSDLGFPPYSLMDVECKNAETKAEIFLRLEQPADSLENMRQNATNHFLSARHHDDSQKALVAVAGKIDPRLATALSEAAEEWKKTKKAVSRELGGMGLRVNDKGLAIFTVPQVHYDVMGFGGRGKRLDRP